MLTHSYANINVNCVFPQKKANKNNRNKRKIENHTLNKNCHYSGEMRHESSNCEFADSSNNNQTT
jgi:hypothetical protein